MKVLVVTLFAVLSGTSAGSVAWPGARVVQRTLLASPTVLNTVVPPQTNVYGFSTTQYINAVPSSVPIALQPQVHYQVPQLAHFAPVQQTYYPIAGGSYYPSNVFYPPFAITPSAPGYPITPIAPALGHPAQGIPSLPPPGFPAQDAPNFPPQGAPGSTQDQPNFPSQTAGDSDTAVVDSADFPQQQDEDKSQEQSPTTEAPQQNQTAPPQSAPAGSFPSLPQAPSFPSIPQFPQYPQGGAPTFPQFPQGDVQPAFPSFPQYPQGDGQPAFPSFPQFPQGSLPQFPQLPQFPSNPNFPQSPTPAPPSSFPGSSDGDTGLNDEDTVSVESA